MEAYIVKYALTKGIIKVEGAINGENFATNKNYFGNLYFPNEFALTYEEACKKANILKNRKIKSLRKQLIKLESLHF